MMTVFDSFVHEQAIMDPPEKAAGTSLDEQAASA